MFWNAADFAAARSFSRTPQTERVQHLLPICCLPPFPSCHPLPSPGEVPVWESSLRKHSLGSPNELLREDVDRADGHKGMLPILCPMGEVRAVPRHYLSRGLLSMVDAEVEEGGSLS